MSHTNLITNYVILFNVNTTKIFTDNETHNHQEHSHKCSITTASIFITLFTKANNEFRHFYI